MSHAQHQPKNDSLFKITMNLTFVCLSAALVIAVTYFFTAERANQKKLEMKNEAMKELVAEAEQFVPVPQKEAWISAMKGQESIAYLLPIETKGYAGTIKMLVALKPDHTVISYQILAHTETPGLGDKAAKDPFRAQFKDKTQENLSVVKDPSINSKIQAITGATITSRAVTQGVKQAVEELKQWKGEK